MPYRTQYGSHYHMLEGCHGATIPCDTAGLMPCSTCCGDVADRDAGRGSISAAVPVGVGSPVPGLDGDAQLVTAAGGGGQAPDEDEDRSGIMGIINRIRAVADATDPKADRQPMPSPSLRRIRDFRKVLERINDACDEMAWESAARKFPHAPKSPEERFLEACLLSLRVDGCSDMRFASRLAECATVSIGWATSTQRLPSRPMGAELELADISKDDHYPTRSARIVGYSLVEAPPEMRKKGVAGIACKAEIACSGGVLGGTVYEGIDNFLWRYTNVSPSLTMVPLSADEWRRANDACDAYEADVKAGTEPASRPLDGIGKEVGDKLEVVGGRVSETAGCDGVRRLFDGESNGRYVTTSSFVMTPREWEETRKALMGKRRRR